MKKDVVFFIKLGKFGIFATTMYFIFLVYIFVENIVSGNLRENID